MPQPNKMVQMQGENFRKEHIDEIEIPPVQVGFYTRNRNQNSALLLELWNLCHSLKKHIQEHCN